MSVWSHDEEVTTVRAIGCRSHLWKDHGSACGESVERQLGRTGRDESNTMRSPTSASIHTRYRLIAPSTSSKKLKTVPLIGWPVGVRPSQGPSRVPVKDHQAITSPVPATTRSMTRSRLPTLRRKPATWATSPSRRTTEGLVRLVDHVGSCELVDQIEAAAHDHVQQIRPHDLLWGARHEPILAQRQQACSHPQPGRFGPDPLYRWPCALALMMDAAPSNFQLARWATA